MTLRRLVLVVAAAPLLAACSIIIGAGTETCGERHEGRGPAVLVTKDQELCEIVRIRVAQALEDDPAITYAKVDELRETSADWQHKKTVESLVDTIRREAGDMTADAVQRAVDSVLAQSKRPLRVEGDDVEPCLVKGMAKGARLALLRAGPWRTDAPAEAAPEK